VPVLFMSGTLNGRTYPESARELIKRFSKGSHLIVVVGQECNPSRTLNVKCHSHLQDNSA
jgi:hypothetical protein